VEKVEMIRSSSFYIFVSLSVVSLAFKSSAQATQSNETTVLAPIVVEGSTADALLYDPIVSTQTERTSLTGSNGSVVRQFEEQLPLPVTDYGTPGTSSQLRGLGRTVEDNNVQTLGVPLNPVQGGGFDLSTFPQFFWSSYSFHLGPSTGAFDPRAASSTLSLTPWTADALRVSEGKSSARARLTEMVSTDLNQASVAGAYGNVAALVGLSSYNAKGPTGSISAQVFHDDHFDIRAHLLATSIDQKSPNDNVFPSPNARLKNTRLIPILEASIFPSHELLFKESVFFDRASIRYVDPDQPFFNTYDRSSQFGSETVALYQDWTFGLSFRRTDYTQIGGQAPNEWIGHFQAERLFRANDWTTQASIQADWMNLYGARPGASFGERYDLTNDWGVFAKANFTYRYPTLLDRYYQGAGNHANPDLTLERALSFNLGNQWKKGQFEATEQFFLQFRANAQVYDYNLNTVLNSGDVSQLSYWDDLTWHATQFLDLGNALRLSSSRVDRTGSRIPYDPFLTEILSLRFHERSDRPLWNAGGSFRVVSRSPGAGGTNGGYALWDLDAGLRVSRFGMQGRVDNVLDRPVQVIQGYPWPGRLFSLSLLAQL
jgi:hypothetical protein